MRAISQFFWIAVAAILILLASVFSPEIELGELVLRRTDPRAFTLFVANGFLGAALLLGVVLLVRGSRFGLVLCQWWGAAYGVAMLGLLYANFAFRDVLAIVVMGVFALVWYFGVSRSASKAAEPASGAKRSLR
jgi:uncharacterized membrane protein